MDASRTLLAKIPDELKYKLSGEALAYSNHTKNNIPHSTTKKIPQHQLLKYADKRNFQEFFSPAWVYSRHTNKLMPRATKMYFVGYNDHHDQGYRFYNPVTGTIHLSSDAKFIPQSTTSNLLESANLINESQSNVTAEPVTEPKTFVEAANDPGWLAAINAELDTLLSMNTFKPTIVLKR